DRDELEAEERRPSMSAWSDGGSKSKHKAGSVPVTRSHHNTLKAAAVNDGADKYASKVESADCWPSSRIRRLIESYASIHSPARQPSISLSQLPEENNGGVSWSFEDQEYEPAVP
ncbi:hypothetical protein OC842_007705, partial [Tilletia horrida]